MIGKSSLKLIALWLCACVGLALSQSQPTTQKLLSKDDLLESLKIARQRGLVSAKDYVNGLTREIKQNGVDFELGKKDEAELRAAGANKVILDAVRQNFRGSKIPNPNRHATAPLRPTPTPTPEIAPPKSGPPFSLDEILEWLRKGATSGALELAIHNRQVSFLLEPESRNRIIGAGGGEDLLNAIKKSPSREALAEQYWRLIVFAEERLNANQWTEAETVVDEAISLDSTKPEAYGLRGEINLYKWERYELAERDMAEAIRRGGFASFRVVYDCGGGKTCPGRLLINKDTFTFRQSASQQWTIPDQEIVKAEPGGKKWNADKGGFIIKTTKNLTYNFLPNSATKNEALLIIKLIKNY